MTVHHLAEVNIGRLVAPKEHDDVKEFMDALEPINALAERSPGFVWRLQDDAGDATSIRVFDDEAILINLSTWTSVETLRSYVYSSEHKAYLARRKEWFEAFDGIMLALWWVPEGHEPTPDEARERLEHLELHGPTPHAFTFRTVAAP